MDSRVRTIVAAATVGAVLASGSAAASASPVAAARSHVWGTAQEAPGTASLNQDGAADIVSVSCAKPGNCSAGGHYRDGSGHGEVFVVSQTHGTWGKAIEVPGTAALNQGVYGTDVTSVSCGKAGNCSAGGYYSDRSNRTQAFVVSQAHGTWGTAIEVPGTAALNQGGNGAEVTSVSCASAGNCSAGGYYSDRSGRWHAFVVSQTHGTWGTAIEVAGTARRQGQFAEVTSVSCAKAGTCSAGGQYVANGSGHAQAFVVSQVRGTWGKAVEVPGTAALDRGGFAEVTSVSCASAGNCSAGGHYAKTLSRQQVFVVSQTRGIWGTAIEVPGTDALNQGEFDDITSVSCGKAGNCSAGGDYLDSSNYYQAFVVSQAHGTWGTAIEVPGTAALNQDGQASANSVSCAEAGNCSAGGFYDSSHGIQAFVVSQTHGIWGTATEMPGTDALNQGGFAQVSSVSCAKAGECGAGGQYSDSTGGFQAFVASQT